MTTGLAAGLSLYALYWVVGIVQPQVYRVSFLLIALTLTFLLYPASQQSRSRVTPADWLLVGLAGIALGWPLVDLNQFVYRAATPTSLDLVLGIATTVLVLEATRRTVGLILPVTAVAFLAYGYYGPWLELIGLDLIVHRGYDTARLVGTLYMTLEGIFGVPLDVAATYIVLFTIFGSVLTHSWAGQFFINWTAFCLRPFGQRCRTGADRDAVRVSARDRLGQRRGDDGHAGRSGLAAAETAGFSPEVGGGILSASGIGAIMAPPTMGAAAFLIAEFLNISYLQVIVMAIIPAGLYYLSIILMIEADARRLGTRGGRCRPAIGRHPHPHIGISVSPASRHGRLVDHGYHAVSRCVLRDVTRRRSQFSPQGDRAATSSARRGARGRRKGGALGCRHHGNGWSHRRRRDPHRPWTEDLRHHRDARRRQRVSDGCVRRDRRVDARLGRPRHRVVHHRGGHDRASAHAGRSARGGRAHVHLLLRGPLRSESADSTVTVCRRRDHGWQSIQDHDADLEVHVTSVPGSVRFHPEPRRPRGAAAGAMGRRPPHGWNRGDRRERTGDGPRRVADTSDELRRTGPGYWEAVCFCSSRPRSPISLGSGSLVARWHIIFSGNPDLERITVTAPASATIHIGCGAGRADGA